MNKVLNNEVIIIGKLLRVSKKLRIQNQDAIQLIIEVEDDNFKNIKNKVFAYALTDSKILLRNFIGKEIGISGHILTHMGTKLIVDVIQMA